MMRVEYIEDLPESTIKKDDSLLHELTLMVSKIFAIISMLLVSTKSTVQYLIDGALTVNFDKDVTFINHIDIQIWICSYHRNCFSMSYHLMLTNYW